MNTTLVRILAFSAALCVQPVVAEEASKPSYSVDAIVSHMIEQADLGAPRGICIGTRSECEENRPKPRGFDMLVTFELDSADLLPEAKRNLETVAAALNDDRLKVAKFKVEGHTDAFGTDEYNLRLSEERAKAVTDFLVQQNVERERILAVGLGKASPRTDDPYDPGNRRVELNLSLE